MYDQSSQDLKKAVKDLRSALGKTQTEFGVLIGKGLATVQRYEALVPPKGKTLVTLSTLADANSQPVLAALFRSALEKEIGALHAGISGFRTQEALILAIGILQPMIEGKLSVPKKTLERLNAVKNILDKELTQLREATTQAPPLDQEDAQ